MYLLYKYTFLMFDLIQTEFFIRLCHDFQNLCVCLLHNFIDVFFFFLTLDLIQTDVFLPSYVMIFKISLGCLKNVKPSFSRISLWESGHPCAMFS